jgi:hypothetical protein
MICTASTARVPGGTTLLARERSGSANGTASTWERGASR